MATSVQAAEDEIVGATAALQPSFDGLVDLSKLPLQAEAAAGVSAAATAFGRRLDLLRAAGLALEALVADGYPDVPQQIISAAAFAELQLDVQKMEAAFSKFQADRAVALNLQARAPVPK